jgi:hypothetical protein
MAYNRASRFTTEHARPARVVEQLRDRSSAILLQRREDANRPPSLRVDVSPSLQEMIDVVFRPPGTDDAFQNVTTLVLGTPEVRRDTSPWRPWNRLVVEQDMLKLYAGIEYLRQQEGQKHLILLTVSGLVLPIRIANEVKGLRVESADDDRRLAARANDAAVSLDIIHTSGNSSASAFMAASSKNISEHTGGQFTSVRTADDALARIDEATRAGYVLGYVPAKPDFDGRYRDISVTVNRPNVTLLYRRGYTARPDAPPVNLRDIITRQRLRDAATLDLAQRDIPLRASASQQRTADGTLQVRVDLVIDGSPLTLTKEGSKLVGMIDVLILCGDARQEVVGTLDQQMTLGLDDLRYRQAIENGIPYSALIKVNRAATRVKVLVYDYESDRLGMVDVDVTRSPPPD